MPTASNNCSTPNELLEHLKHFEGWVPDIYKCPAGYDTVGYGHRVYPGDGISSPLTKGRGEELLLEDIAKYTMMAVRLSPGLINDAPRRLNGVIDFLFNCGGSAYAGSQLRLAVNRKDWAAAAVQNGRWIYITDPVTKQKHTSAWQIKRRAVTSAWLRQG